MNYINERIMNEADLLIETGFTIRELAEIFDVSKSTVHKDLHERLYKINKDKYNEVKKVLDYHVQVRHIRGGRSTKLKYLKG